MPEKVRIALDAMGGDHGPSVVVPGAERALAEHPDSTFILFGDRAKMDPLLDAHPRLKADARVVHTDVAVRMDDKPSQALRNGRWKSSMWLAIDAVKKGEADVAVSAGNTGALMATARFVLKTLADIDRPAICTSLPTVNGHVHALDLGANVDCTPEQLVQFAIMGSILVSELENKPRPRVGLLNVGEEDIKGNETVKKAHELLRASSLNYVGYAEGDQIYLGDLDVIVCDGFVGNVALKTSEGLAKMIGQFLRQEFKRNPLTMLAALVAAPVLRAFRNRLDPRRYNGASLLGLTGTVIKSHGGADVFAMRHAILEACAEVRRQVPARIGQELQAMAQQRQPA
jgi:glycerol-3-phosphate acyltransferase PlsX